MACIRSNNKPKQHTQGDWLLVKILKTGLRDSGKPENQHPKRQIASYPFNQISNCPAGTE